MSAELASLEQLIKQARAGLSRLVAQRDAIINSNKRHRSTHEDMVTCQQGVRKFCAKEFQTMRAIVAHLEAEHKTTTIKNVVKQLKDEGRLVMIGSKRTAMYMAVGKVDG